MDTLKAEKRDLSIKAKRLRREGYVTANIFGRKIKNSIPVQLVKAEAERLLKTKNRGSQLMLEVDGQQYDVLIKDISYNPLKRQIEEIDFQALVSDEKVHSVAEVVLLNHDKLVGGIISQVLHEIPYKALPAALVEKVEIDLANLKIGDTVKVGDLAIAADKDVELGVSLEAQVLMITEPHNASADEPAAEGETAEPKEEAK